MYSACSCVLLKRFCCCAANVNADTMDEQLLGDGTLINNLGLPVVVCCCKADFVEVLERDFDYSDETFEFVEQVAMHRRVLVHRLCALGVAYDLFAIRRVVVLCVGHHCCQLRSIVGPGHQRADSG